jgi:hypothetical protein
MRPALRSAAAAGFGTPKFRHPTQVQSRLREAFRRVMAAPSNPDLTADELNARGPEWSSSSPGLLCCVLQGAFHPL